MKEANLAAYKKKKEGKVKPAAKSIVTLDVKPWGGHNACLMGRSHTDIPGASDDETDMKELEANMRGIEMDGLTWGASKLVAVGYGISKLQVNLVVEDEKVSIDDLQGQIEGDEDHVQSTDVVRHFHFRSLWLPANGESCNRLPCKSFRLLEQACGRFNGFTSALRVLICSIDLQVLSVTLTTVLMA